MSHFWDIGKQCRSKSGAAEPLKEQCTRPNNKDGIVLFISPLAEKGLND